MVGWLRTTEERRWRPIVEPARILDLPLVEVSLPPGDMDRRVGQGARALRKRGVGRVLVSPQYEGADLTRWGLRMVDPLPLCRALGADLALELLKGVPLRERRVALRGSRVDRDVFRAAQLLCPQAGELLLDMDRGGEELAAALRARYGAPPRTLVQGGEPQVSLEFGPRPAPAGVALRLWGRPDLAGVVLSLGRPLPGDLPGLPFLSLLWEEGRVKKGDILLRKP